MGFHSISALGLPMSKESCLFVSRNLLYHVAGDLPPLRDMGNILGYTLEEMWPQVGAGITVKPVYCIVFICSLIQQTLMGAYYRQTLCEALRMQRGTKERMPLTSWSL